MKMIYDYTPISTMALLQILSLCYLFRNRKIITKCKYNMIYFVIGYSLDLSILLPIIVNSKYSVIYLIILSANMIFISCVRSTLSCILSLHILITLCVFTSMYTPLDILITLYAHVLASSIILVFIYSNQRKISKSPLVLMLMLVDSLAVLQGLLTLSI